MFHFIELLLVIQNQVDILVMVPVFEEAVYHTHEYDICRRVKMHIFDYGLLEW